MPRYLIERTFPAGALSGLTPEIKRAINIKNAAVGVKWVQSYANSDLTKTYCVYEGPNEGAIREAGKNNEIPIDQIIEIPNDILPQ